MKNLLHIILYLFISNLLGEAYLAGIFHDGMILQRDKQIKVWGYGDPGDEVIISISDQKIRTEVNDNDKWFVTFQPLKMSKEPICFQFESEGYIKNLDDVLVGDVWFCSGQSNMVLSVSHANNAIEEIQNSKNRHIRLFTVTQSFNSELYSDQEIVDHWEYCSSANVKNFSATAYFFGRSMNKELDVPIGLINSSYGSSMIESWTSLKGNRKVESGSKYIDDIRNNLYPELEPRHLPSAIYNTMVHPFADFSIKGFIWYQGERNTRTNESCFNYRYQLPALIDNWRSLWNDNTLPFYFVQLPNYQIDYNWALMRESMEFAEETPNSGMAVTIDIGESDNIHPANKQEVGRRLAFLALNRTFGKNIIDSGPKYESFTINNEQIIMNFVNSHDGLKYTGEKINGFEISSDDKLFHKAEAQIIGNKIVVSSVNVKDPVAVRYGWSSDPECNVYNSANLPLRPFRTDKW